MILLGLASLQLQRDPKILVASCVLLNRIVCSVQVSTESLLLQRPKLIMALHFQLWFLGSRWALTGAQTREESS